MTVKDLVPWPWNRSHRKVVPLQQDNPFDMLQRQMNSLFDDFFSGFGGSPLRAFSGTNSFSPRLDVAEDERQIKITAELPGLEEKDIELSLTKDALTLRGEKKGEREEHSDSGNYYAERSYGSFERIVPLNAEVEEDKVDASFKNGILTIVLPKSARAQETSKKISIRS